MVKQQTLKQIYTEWIRIGDAFSPFPNGDKREKLYQKWIALEKEMYTIASKNEIQEMAKK